MSGRTIPGQSEKPGENRLKARPAANDNALARIARDIRRTAFGWRHAQAVASFVDGRRQVLAAYDDLRERTRIEGDAVALSGAYRETLTRHAVLLKQAESFRARPGEFASLLAERGGIGRKDSRCLQGTPYTGAPAPARGHDALRASGQAGGRTTGG